MNRLLLLMMMPGVPLVMAGCVTLEGGVYGGTQGESPRWELSVRIPLIPDLVNKAEPEEESAPVRVTEEGK